MGNYSGHLKKTDLEALYNVHFEPEQMWKQLKRENPLGIINRQEFIDGMKQMGINDAFLIELLFNIIDDNKNGSITFAEFACAISAMAGYTGDTNKQ